MDHLPAFFYRVADQLHRRLFREGLHSGARTFLHDISWSMVSGLVAGALMMATNILTGRLLGPTEYGKINLVMTIAQIVLIFILFGMDRSSMRSIAMQTEKEGKAGHLSTTFFFVLLTTVACSLLFVLIAPWIARLTGIDLFVLSIGFTYGVVISWRQLVNNFIRGLQQFKYQAITRMFEAFLSLLIFAAAWAVLDDLRFGGYIAILVAVGLTFILLYLFRVRSFFQGFNKEFFFSQFSFGRLYFMASAIGIVFSSLDKFLIGKYISLQDLGIYSAYFGASVGLMAQLNTIFGNVFFTTVAKHLRYLPSILRKLDKLTMWGFLPLFVFSFAILFTILKLFGKSYPFDPVLAILFSLLAILVSIYSVNASVIQAYSTKAFSQVFVIGNIINIFFIGIYAVVISFTHLSIIWVVSILVCYYILLNALCKFSLWRAGGYGSQPEPVQDAGMTLKGE